ncbi:MAG: UPF0182 family protein [Candidatus Aenigmatarchaeota archaeon]
MIRRLLIPLIFIVFFIVQPLLTGLYTDFLWFGELGYRSVFMTMLLAQVQLFLIAGAAFFTIIFLSTRLATASLKPAPKPRHIVLLALPIAALAGLIVSGSWEVLLRFLNFTAFGITDPVFGADLSFYFFELPFYTLIWQILFGAFLLSALFAGGLHISKILSYKAKVTEEAEGHSKPAKSSAKKQVLFILPLAGVIFVLLGFGLLLHRYSVLYSTLGSVNGAGWTDMNIVLPFLTILAIASFALGALFFAGSRRQNIRLPLLGTAALAAVAIVSSIAILATQSFMVVPDEFNREKPFLERNIEFTRQAYGLERIKEFPFPAHTELTAGDVKANAPTMQNVRLWDWKPLLQTYKQVQLIRTYYDFADADVDRYTINGEYKQVIVSAREINPKLIPDRTWVNERFVFTHGYGITMTPVREVTAEGLPLLYVKDIPPQSLFFNITRPEVYFGELVSEYIIINTTTEELDYPFGEDNVYTTYKGKAGISLSSPLTRLLMSIRFGSVEILVSGSITDQSRILMKRNILERARSIAPYMLFDSDPYIVTDSGKLYWILDGYTVSNRYPYSERIRGINYIRNPVKVIIDAYDGSTTFYVVEEEPLIKTYSKIFPGLFRPLKEMPDGLRAHIRYPLDIFAIQASIFNKYHMQDPRVFYNKEDLWEIPTELFEQDTVRVDPYYMIMQLPGEERVEYVLSQTFSPRSKKNIIAWLAGRSDFPNYGDLVLYRFPKEKLIFGPMQMEARINQDDEIAKTFALWSQAGTRVLRGHVNILPLNGSLLYIEPIYLSAETAALPELRRVIVMFGDRLTMQPTLDAALGVIFGTEPGLPVAELPSTLSTVTTNAQTALRHYEAAQVALREGDWATYGRELESLRRELEALAAADKS